MIEVTSLKTKQFLEGIFSFMQNQNISEIDCNQYYELLEISGDINIKHEMRLSTGEYSGTQVLKLFGQSTFELPLIINSYIYDMQGRFFIVEVYSERDLERSK